MTAIHTRADVSEPCFPGADRKEHFAGVTASLQPVFAKHAEQSHIPGLAYGVIIEGELTVAETMGVGNLATHAQVTPDTVFRIASMTKSFAAAAILRLRDEGHLRLDEPAATYVPALAAWTYPTADSPLVTVRHLLSMAAGWPEDNPWGDRQLYRTDAEMDDFYAAGVPWSNVPGVDFEYSNYGYMVLGRIITNIAGMPAIEYINRQFIQPLGMESTFWQAADVPPARLAHGYRWEDDQWKEESPLPSGGDVAAFAGIFTSLPDLARWVAFFQSAWPPRNEADNGPLRRSSLREMQQIWRTHTPELTFAGLGKPPAVLTGGYGFGLTIHNTGQWESVGHGGGLPGFGSYMTWAPSYGIGIIGLANVTYARMGLACRQALAALIDQSKARRRRVSASLALTVAREEVISLLATWDDERADALVADNFFLDVDREHRLKEIDDLHRKHGALTPTGDFKVENWLRGQWRMLGERGWCNVAITLAPTMPPRLQALDIDSTLPPSPALQAAADALTALTAHPRRRELRRLCAKEVDLDALWDQVLLAGILCGPCSVDEVTGGNGETWAEFRFKGTKAIIAVTVRVNRRGKATEVVFRPIR